MLRSVLTAFLLAALLAGPAPAGTPCDPSQLDILAGQHRHRFAVEIADDPAEQARGLMFRTSLPADTGMLFIFDPPSRTHFWMRNTMIPLDMLFIDDAGRVESIAERRDTFSDRVSSSRGPVRAVLEVGGGIARLLGITPGAQVVHPAFQGAPEALHCAE